MRRTTLTAALGLALVLTGCSADGDSGTQEPSAGAATDAATVDGGAATGDAAPMSDPVCAGFFQTGAVTLAERAETDRGVLEAGDTLDPASWGEINLLSQRLVDLTEDASGDQGALLERINAPFVEASDAVLDDPEKTPNDPEITVPEIDVTDSAAAQGELETACAG
jgi:hypothetical protein